jgi:hypothetical protein
MGPGAPSDIGPDGGLVDPGMIGPDGMPADEGMPPGEDPGGEDPLGAPPDGEEDGSPPGGDSGGGDGPPPKDKKSKSKKESARRYAGLEGQTLTEEQFLRHVAVRVSGAHPRVLARMRAEGARRRRPFGRSVMAARVEHNHDDMSGHELRRHMRSQHGFIDSPDDPDWLVDQTHRDEHADAPLDHVHPDLDEWPEHGEDVHLDDRDWMYQNGIEASRRYYE